MGDAVAELLLVILILLVVESRPWSSAWWTRHRNPRDGVGSFLIDDGVDGDVEIRVDPYDHRVAKYR